MIEGIHVRPLEVISDNRGRVMHMVRRDAPFFTVFGEVYFSVVNPSIVKAWKRHLRMTQRLAVPVGRIRLVAFDDREDSSTRGRVQILEMGEDDYKLVQVPPGLWYGFAGIARAPSLIANCTDLPHDPAEAEARPLDDPRIPYTWEEPKQ